jgi:hypothetical protein
MPCALWWGVMNTKVIVMAVVGLMLIGTNMAVVSPMVMSNTEAALEDATVMTDDTWEDDSWLSSTLERVFFAWDLTNPNDAKADSDGNGAEDLGNAVFERNGPFIYNVTAKREVISHNEDQGTLTYSEFNEYEWCAECTWSDENGTEHASVSGTTPITNINILYDTQRIGALGSVIASGPDIVKGTFTKKMLEIDMAERAPSIWTVEELNSDLSVYASNETLVGNGPQQYRDLGAKIHVLTQNSRYDEENLTTFMMTAFNESILNHIFDNVTDNSTGLCIALTCNLGPMLIKRMGAPDTQNSLARAELYGYTVFNNDTTVNQSATIMADEVVYDAINTRYTQAGYFSSDLRSESDANLKSRMVEMAGISENFDETKMQNLLFGMNGNAPVGILVCDSNGFLCGVTNLLLLAIDFNLPEIMSQYGLGLTSLEKVAGDWVSKWQLAERNYEMILSDGSGFIHADEWVLEAFGSKDPVDGKCIPFGLNIGVASLNGLCFWESTYNPGNPVDLDPAQTHNILYGDYGLTTDFATDFLYGEISGMSVPMNEQLQPEIGGTQHAWDDAFVAGLYDIDLNGAMALRWMLFDTLFNDNIGGIIESQYGVEPVLTMEVNNWLLGWEDPLVGWASLEDNATYYGSDGIVNDGAKSIYTVYTGAKEGLPGQLLFEWDDNDTPENMSDDVPLCDFKPAPETSPCFLSWRSSARDDATYGLLGTVDQANVVGTVFPAGESARMSLAGYAVAESVVVGKDSIEGIDTYKHSINVPPLENPIQAKLLGQESLLDVFPNALPVYFGGEVEMQVEPSVNAVLGLEMNSYFFIDTRGISRSIGLTAPTEGDLQPVFQISIAKSIGDDPDDVDAFKDKVIHNQRPYAYWTNFDTGADAMFIDQVTFLIWLIADLLLLAALVMAVRGDSDLEEPWTETEEE